VPGGELVSPAVKALQGNSGYLGSIPSTSTITSSGAALVCPGSGAAPECPPAHKSQPVKE